MAYSAIRKVKPAVREVASVLAEQCFYICLDKPQTMKFLEKFRLEITLAILYALLVVVAILLIV